MPIEILLINCYTEKKGEKIEPYLHALRQAAGGLGLEISVHEENDDALSGSPIDLAVVTGSPKMVGEGEFEQALADLMRAYTKPMLGICYGHQLLARAFGGTIRSDNRKHTGNEEVSILVPGGLFDGFPNTIPMRESHKEVVMRDDVLKSVFVETAESFEGGLEGIRHREHPLFGVQFHPEVSGDWGQRLFTNLLRMIR